MLHGAETTVQTGKKECGSGESAKTTEHYGSKLILKGFLLRNDYGYCSSTEQSPLELFFGS